MREQPTPLIIHATIYWYQIVRRAVLDAKAAQPRCGAVLGPASGKRVIGLAVGSTPMPIP